MAFHYQLRRWFSIYFLKKMIIMLCLEVLEGVVSKRGSEMDFGQVVELLG
jgi:hypothetical protein